MAVPNLREAFEATSKPVVDLGNKTWQLAPNDTLKFKRSLVGDGAAKILVPTAKDRDIPALVARGADQRFAGFEMIGHRPQGQAFAEKREAQHFLRMDGVLGGSVEAVTFRNGWGDAIYQGPGEDGRWCREVEIVECVFEEMGRHHVTVNASDECEIRGGSMGWSARAAVDCEPGGRSGGARFFRWLDTTITAAGNHFPVFANGGVGTSRTVHHITLDGIRCPNREFSVTVNPDPEDDTLYRSEYVIAHCSGKGPKGVNQPQLVFRKVHGVYLLDIDQPTMPGVPLAVFDRCERVRNLA